MTDTDSKLMRCRICGHHKQDHDIIETESHVYRVCNIDIKGKRCDCSGFEAYPDDCCPECEVKDVLVEMHYKQIGIMK